MDFVVSTCILHFIVATSNLSVKIVKHLLSPHRVTHTIHNCKGLCKVGGAPAPGAPLLPTPLYSLQGADSKKRYKQKITLFEGQDPYVMIKNNQPVIF